MGGVKFKKMVKEHLLGKKIDFSEVPAYNEYRVKITAEEVVAKSAKAFQLTVEDLRKKRDISHLKIKRAIIYVCRKSLQLTAHDIGCALGGITRAVITRHYHMAVIEEEKKKGCYREIEKVAKIIQ